MEEDGLWRIVFRDAGAAVVVLDRDLRLVRANPEMARFLGRDDADLVGTSIADSAHPDDRAALLEGLRGLADEGGRDRCRLELRFVRKDGSETWGLLAASAGRDGAGRRAFLIGVVQDIDDRKRAEAATAAAESRLRALIDAMPAYVSEIGADHRYLVVNRFYEQMCRGDRAALEGSHVREVLGDVAYRRLADRIALALAGREVTYDDTLDFGRGPRRLRVTYIPRSDGGGVGSFFVFGIDDTERATAERERHEALQRLEERTRMLDAVLSATADSISMFDRDGLCLYASRRAARALGLAQAGLVGKRLQEFGMPAEFVRQIDGHRMLAAATGRPMTAEIDVQYAEGQRHFEYTMNPVKDGDGATVAVVATGRDMTARKRIEDGIRRSLAEKEVLLREVHHRVKNNMQVIVSLLNLQSQNFRQPELRQSHEELGNRIRALALVHQMLIDGPALERIDLAHYAERLSGQLRRFYLDGSARVAVGLSLQPVTVGMDEAVPLGLILNELLSNALAHAFPGDRKGAVTVNLQAGNGGFELSVADDGVGFDGDEPPDGPGLGVRLVGVLTRQIGGELRYRTLAPGTSATVQWSRPAG